MKRTVTLVDPSRPPQLLCGASPVKRLAANGDCSSRARADKVERAQGYHQERRESTHMVVVSLTSTSEEGKE
jgi:hypothetical protein